MNTSTSSTTDLGLKFARTVAARHAPGTYPWHYETGLILLALLRVAGKSGDASLAAYVRSCAEDLVASDGSIKGYRVDEHNLDQVNPGRVLLELEKSTGDRRWTIAARKLRDQLAEQPRTTAGGFWHKRIYPHQMWLDGLYMQGPFSVAWGLANGDKELVEDVCDQLALVEAKTVDPATGLLHHAWDESRKQLWADPATGRSPHAWGRAMGWFSMAVADCMDLLPVDHPRRAELAAILLRTAKTIIARRDADSGIWLQVLDQPGRPGNYPEASASAMFCYSLAVGVRLGVLAEDPFLCVAREAVQALTCRYVRTNVDGGLSLGGICKVAGLGGEPYRDGSFGYYVGEPVVADDFKGVGPFILACLELG